MPLPSLSPDSLSPNVAGKTTFIPVLLRLTPCSCHSFYTLIHELTNLVMNSTELEARGFSDDDIALYVRSLLFARDAPTDHSTGLEDQLTLSLDGDSKKKDKKKPEDKNVEDHLHDKKKKLEKEGKDLKKEAGEKIKNDEQTLDKDGKKLRNLEKQVKKDVKEEKAEKKKLKADMKKEEKKEKKKLVKEWKKLGLGKTAIAKLSKLRKKVEKLRKAYEEEKKKYEEEKKKYEKGDHKHEGDHGNRDEERLHARDWI